MPPEARRNVSRSSWWIFSLRADSPGNPTARGSSAELRRSWEPTGSSVRQTSSSVAPTVRSWCCWRSSARRKWRDSNSV